MSLLPDAGLMRRADRPGRLTLIGAGPGAADLMSFRAADRLRQADIVLHDRLIGPDVLAMIPAATPRVDVGKDLGHHRWTQGSIDALIRSELRRGLHVVRLKSGDPSIFGRAVEEIAAAEAEGAAVEIVPGITAASAAAASLGRPLTTRGVAQRLVLATATDCDGKLAGRLDGTFGPGTTVALYMGLHKLAGIRDTLLASGADPQTAVTVIASCSLAGEHHVTLPLEGLTGALDDPRLTNPAIILASWGQLMTDAPKAHALTAAE